MQRDHFNFFSPELGRHMEMLTYTNDGGHFGMPVIVFPTSQGRFYEFEDNQMVHTLADHIDGGRIELYCVDSVDSESWYNRSVGPDWRVARQAQYVRYIVNEVVGFVRFRNSNPKMITLGCSLGGYHALNTALQHPWTFNGCLSMSGAFDMEKLGFLGGYHDQNAYFNQPMNFVPNMNDGHALDRMRQNKYILATGEHDQCWNDNERMNAMLHAKGIPSHLYVWGDGARHDWPLWRQQVQMYL
jgi:esterase/lipase superfamily enzyme